MSCCGRKTDPVQGGARISRRLPVSALSAQSPVFQYTGPTSMAVIGHVSGLRYSFRAAGQRLPVDPRDLRSLTAVPHLRRII
jgi:hypothetical protein